jgi:hypothetical protein
MLAKVAGLFRARAFRCPKIARNPAHERHHHG